MTWDETPTITVRQLLDLFPKLGVPHFQRGRVWGKDAIAALLESLFYETPCGSLVLRNSGNNASYGVSLGESDAIAVKYLVIDGQQRIRSLREAFDDSPLNDDDEPGAEETGGRAQKRKHWCVNLDQAPSFRDLVEQRRRPFSLFVYTTHPRDAKPRSPLRHNVLPLESVRRAGSWDDLRDFHSLVNFRPGKVGQGHIAYDLLRQSILAIERQPFFVALKDSTCSLATMAELYNRINAAGKQVEIEERAFATLVGLQTSGDSISDGLRDTFAAIHRDGRAEDGRDAWLKRQEERAFGFKLFVRVFLQVCQYHFGFRQWKSSFSFDLVDRDDFRQAFSTRSLDEIGLLWDETREVLLCVRSLLSRHLQCDDLRMLPDATGLMPVIQLLIQYPALRGERYERLLAALCLEIALADVDTRTLLRWVAEAGNPTRLAFEVVPNLLKDAHDRASKQLASCLDDASSIQDRYVLLLYWLERHSGARDFRYDKLPKEAKPPAAPERCLEKAAEPEKQHLVPFSYASRIFASEVRRTAFHSFNNIGNLTYISAELNGLGALSNRFADLEGEREADHSNFAAHFLGGADGDGFLKQYVRLRKHLESETTMASGSGQRLEPEFLRLTETRQRLIREGFKSWLAHLHREALVNLNVESLCDLESGARIPPLRIEPGRPLFPINKETAHVLRSLDLDNEAEDRLLEVVNGAKRTTVVSPSQLRMQITRKKQVWIDVQGQSVCLGVRRLEGALRADLLATVGRPDSNASSHPLDPVPNLQPLLDYCASHEREIEEAAKSKKKGERSGDAGTHTGAGVDTLGYPEAVRARLHNLRGESQEPPRQGADVSLRFHARQPDGTRQVLRVDLFTGGKLIGFRFGVEFGRMFRERFHRVPVRVSKDLTFCELGAEDEMIAVLDWIADRLPAETGQEAAPPRSAPVLESAQSVAEG